MNRRSRFETPLAVASAAAMGDRPDRDRVLLALHLPAQLRAGDPGQQRTRPHRGRGAVAAGTDHRAGARDGGHGVAIGAPAGPHHPVRAQGHPQPALPRGPDGRCDAVAGLPIDHATQHRAHPADRHDPADHRLAAGLRPALPAHPWWPRLRDRRPSPTTSSPPPSTTSASATRRCWPCSSWRSSSPPVARRSTCVRADSAAAARRRTSPTSRPDGCGSTARRGRDQSPQEWPEDARKRRRWTPATRRTPRRFDGGDRRAAASGRSARPCGSCWPACSRSPLSPRCRWT